MVDAVAVLVEKAVTLVVAAVVVRAAEAKQQRPTGVVALAVQVAKEAMAEPVGRARPAGMVA